MKWLTVLRHAKSSWAEPNSKDLDRPLNERGWKAARRMGRELRHHKMRFDYGLASPAARVRETLDGLAEGYGELSFEVRFDAGIYMADADALLDLVRGLPDEVGTPLLIGHNPGLERLIVELTRDDKDGLRDRVERKYPTGALAVIELPVERWAEAERGNGEVVDLIFPRDLD